MKQIKVILFKFLILGGLFPQMALCKPVTLIDSLGEKVVFEVGSNDKFLDVLEEIQLHFQERKLLACNEPLLEGTLLDKDQLNLAMSSKEIIVRSAKKSFRDYDKSVTKQEKKELSYIIKTLAYDSLFSIGKSRSSLKKSGDRIDHLHPYQFLITVFTDEELKAGIQAIRDRGGLAWSNYIDGVTGSLKEEAQKHNLHQYTSDFAKKVNIDPSLITPALEKEKWKEFISILIDKIPRETDAKRYDM